LISSLSEISRRVEKDDCLDSEIWDLVGDFQGGRFENLRTELVLSCRARRGLERERDGVLYPNYSSSNLLSVCLAIVLLNASIMGLYSLSGS
jgi:hypothetical protein